MKILALILASLALSPLNAQSIFGRPVLLTFDKSTSDNIESPKGVYFTYRATLDPVTGNCNQFSKIGGSGATPSFLDTQTIPGMTYCYEEAFYNGTQSLKSDPPAIVDIP